MRQGSLDEIQRRALDDIKQYGWHLITVPDDDEGPGFVYSVGMMQTLNHPEIIMFGLEPELMADVIDGMGHQIRKGRCFARPGLVDDFLKDYPCKIVPVAKQWHAEYLGYAIWHRRYLGQPDTLQAVQCLWPDKRGRFPDEPSCSPNIKACQPLLARP